jgi:hypothetical protein
MMYLGLDLGHESERAAEHWLYDLVHQLGRPAGVLACTHLTYRPAPHVAVSLALPDGAVTAERPAALPPVTPELREAAGLAAAEHEAGRAGRAVLFPGVDRLTGALTVAEVLATSAIDRITVIGGAPPQADTVVDTHDFVRPHWRDGVLTLIAMPAPGGRIAPFEVPNPTPCCADHQ